MDLKKSSKPDDNTEGLNNKKRRGRPKGSVNKFKGSIRKDIIIGTGTPQEREFKESMLGPKGMAESDKFNEEIKDLPKTGMEINMIGTGTPQEKEFKKSLHPGEIRDFSNVLPKQPDITDLYPSIKVEKRNKGRPKKKKEIKDKDNDDTTNLNNVNEGGGDTNDGAKNDGANNDSNANRRKKFGKRYKKRHGRLYKSRDKNESKAAKSGETKKKTFRIAAKQVLLTYPQCELSKEWIYYNFLQRPDIAKYGVLNYIIAEEKHEDGSPHLHILIEFQKKFDTKNERAFDITATFETIDPETGALKIEEKVFHGDYERTKRPIEAFEYCTKMATNTQEAIKHLIISPGYSYQVGELYEHVALEQRLISLAEIGEIEFAMDLVKRENPKDFVNRGSAIEKRLQEIHMKSMGCTHKYPFESFNIPDDLREVLDLYKDFITAGEAKTLVIQGQSGTGKTQFLKTYFQEVLNLPVLVINDKEGLKYFNPAIHKAIIFDDPNFAELPREDIIHLTDNEATIIKIRYISARIPENTPRAITTNIPVERINPNFADKAVDRRLIIYEIKAHESLKPEGKDKDPNLLINHLNQRLIELKQKRLNKGNSNKTNTGLGTQEGQAKPSNAADFFPPPPKPNNDFGSNPPNLSDIPHIKLPDGSIIIDMPYYGDGDDQPQMGFYPS